MTASLRQRVVLVIVAVIVIASLWRTLSLEAEKRRIATAYDQARQTLSQLQAEREQLSAELGSAQETIEGQTTDLAGLQSELQRVKDELDQSVAELSSLQQSHEQLRQRDASLSSQLGSLMAEKAQLEAKLSSITELRLAIREVTRQIWNERWAAWRARAQALKEEDQRRLAAGNRGYLVREGLPTLGASRRLHVNVLEPQSTQE
jgi:chromosome segregation ATPase